jgi:ATP-binding cassette, subfamily B, bacterial
MPKKFPFYKQLDQMDCGPTCLRMIAKFYGLIISVDELRDRSFVAKDGVSFAGLAEAAESINFHTLALNIPFSSLKDEVPLPCIAYWRQRHFVVIYKIDTNYVHISDPAFGLIKYTHADFTKNWLPHKEPTDLSEGLIMALEPSENFSKDLVPVVLEKSSSALRFLFSYFKPYSKYVFQILLGLFLSTLLNLIFPFLSQALIDKGVYLNDVNFIYIILIAQLTLFVSETVIDVIRTWILLHITSRINISITSNFLLKLMKLSISFYDSKNIGDMVNRLQDCQRISALLSANSLNVVFGVFNILIFGAILAYFSLKIFLIFLVGAFLYVTWVMAFMKKRAELDYRYFEQSSGNQSSYIQLVNGMQEIKLNNSERKRRWQYEGVQIKLFKLSIKSLSITQIQNLGADFINQLKNIIITFLSAKSVIDGEITLGGMLSIQYIIGQLNAPLNNFIGFIQTFQNAIISVQRLFEIYNKADEESLNIMKQKELPAVKYIKMENVCFRYGSPTMPNVLSQLNVNIPQSKVTAIVGASGSGKTTLIKLLLKFYKPVAGTIVIGNTNLDTIHSGFWRSTCGVVMQDGYLFGDTIAKNITESDIEGRIDKEKLEFAVNVANLKDFIEALPMGYNTKIGSIGMGISGGQKQRILIARAVYKNPEYLFFDEATSALDANNEKVIMQNLEDFYKGKTVVIVAHRLSTVKNADNIIVLDKGIVAEQGAHDALIQKQGLYYHLIKNQLELGN